MRNGKNTRDFIFLHIFMAQIAREHQKLCMQEAEMVLTMGFPFLTEIVITSFLDKIYHYKPCVIVN